MGQYIYTVMLERSNLFVPKCVSTSAILDVLFNCVCIVVYIVCVYTYRAVFNVSQNLKHLHLTLSLPLVFIDVTVNEVLRENGRRMGEIGIENNGGWEAQRMEGERRKRE